MNSKSDLCWSTIHIAKCEIEVVIGAALELIDPCVLLYTCRIISGSVLIVARPD